MRINLCGYGWLGQPLAKKLIHSGHQVVATKRSVTPSSDTNQPGIEIIPMTLGETLLQHVKNKLFNCDVLVINIPQGRKTFTPEVFLSSMNELMEQAKNNGTGKVIFVSTTAVYGDREGVVYENTEPMPVTESAKVHLAIEHRLQSIFGTDATVLRLAGLVGAERHPVKHLAGREQIANGQHKVNLVHQRDAINAIAGIIENQVFGHTLHLSCTKHPSRQAYYTWAADKMGLSEPQFLPFGEDENKQINPQYTLNKIGLQLLYPSPYDLVDNYHKKENQADFLDASNLARKSIIKSDS